MNGLLLWNNFNGRCHWYMEYLFDNDSSWESAKSIEYNSEREAIDALLGNKIEWVKEETKEEPK